MLVLSRKENERIVIPSLGIEIVVVRIRGDQARLGIDAPESVKVYRREVYERIQAEEEETSNTE